MTRESANTKLKSSHEATQQMQMQHTEPNFTTNEPEGEGIADHFNCRPEEDAADAPQEAESNGEGNAVHRCSVQRLRWVSNALETGQCSSPQVLMGTK